MSTYIILGSYTEKGITNMKESPKRLDAGRQAAPQQQENPDRNQWHRERLPQFAQLLARILASQQPDHRNDEPEADHS